MKRIIRLFVGCHLLALDGIELFRWLVAVPDLSRPVSDSGNGPFVARAMGTMAGEVHMQWGGKPRPATWQPALRPCIDRVSRVSRVSQTGNVTLDGA